MNSSERERLIDALLDEAITTAEFQALERELQDDPEARQAYYERLQLHTALEAEAEESMLGQVVVVPSDRFRGASVLAWAAAALFVGTLGWWMVASSSPSQNPSMAAEEPVARGFAVVADQAGVSWQLSRGDLVPSGLISLAEGTAQLEFFSGVTVLVEGPARFEVASTMAMRVEAGKVRAVVPPPAQGFRIQTAQGDLVDLGTEFSLEVTPHRADLQVFDGEVEWHPREADMQTLQSGESLSWQGEGVVANVQAEASPRVSELIDALSVHRQERFEAWEAVTKDWQSDGRTVLHLTDPGSASEREWGDRSLPSYPGTIVRAQLTHDRWGHADGALDFSPMGSRVRLVIPGSFQALTLHCWVKIDSLDRWYNSLFLTDGHERHEPHWQIMNDGRLFFSVKAHNRTGPGNPDKQICFSPPFWSPSLSGQWLQLATTFDSRTQEVVHYLNGEILSRERVREEMLVPTIVIGAASIGNWSEPKRQDPDFAVRNLNGAIDDFLLCSEALSPEAIRQLYLSGRP